MLADKDIAGLADLRRETIKAIEEQQESNDTEAAHECADDALVNFIRMLGFDDIADAWDKVPKWYA